MISEKCPTSEELRAFSLGQLNEEQSDEMLGHVQNCNDCRSDLETDTAEDTLIRNLRSGDADAFAEELDCQVAMAKALGALAAPEAIDNSELSQLLPKILGDYEIVSSLGRGGMGNVYLARHQKLGREVALKVLSSHRLLQPRMRQRFETEMRAVGQLSHPNIVTAYDAREVDDLAVLVTEYIDGLDIGQVLRRTGQLSVPDACEIARQTADALGYVDGKGLVHRDIKPSNVMLSRQGEVKLLDLGLARLRIGDEESPEMTATGQAMGTADYIAPEQVNDSRNVDIRADIYALGCTLYKMLSGRAPFGTDRYPTSFAKMTAHVSDTPPTLRSVAPHIPAELATLVDSMIAKDPNDRPQSPAKVAQQLSRFAKSATLGQLAEDALNRAVIAGLSETRDGDRMPVRRPVTQSFFSRRVPLFAAVGAGLLGTLLGVMLGITITIKHPDGTKNNVTLPPGVDAHVAANGDVELQLSAEEKVTYKPGVFPRQVTQESVQGIWRTVSWGHEHQEPAASPAASALYVFHGNKMFPMLDSQIIQDPMPFSIESEKTFSLLTFKPPSSEGMNDVDGPEMKATMQLLSPNRIEMKVAGGPTTMLERIATLPVQQETIKQIKETKETAPFVNAVKTIDEFCRTGTLPARNLAAKNKAMRQSTSSYMRRIGLAILNHESDKARFPASKHQHELQQRFGLDAKPVSWRVKILPYLGEKEQRLYDTYRFNEDWDSENNLKILERMPQAFRGAYAPGSTKTRFLAVAGKNTVIGDKSLVIGDIRDGTSKTILFIEADKSVPWTKPEDITPDEVIEWAQSDGFKGVHAQFVDGSARYLVGDLVKPVNLVGLMSYAGGESVQVERD